MPKPWEKYSEQAQATTTPDKPSGTPWSKYAAPEPDQHSMLDTAADAAKGVLAGAHQAAYGPELSGALSTIPQLEMSDIAHPSQIADKYTKNRDASQAYDQQLRARSPMAGNLGNMAANTAMMAVPATEAAGAVQGAGKLAALLRGGAGGYVAGALVDPGNTPGELNPLQGKQRFKNSIEGAATGAALSGAGQGIAQLLKNPAEVGSLIGADPMKVQSYAKNQIGQARNGLRGNIEKQVTNRSDMLSDGQGQIYPDSIPDGAPGVDNILARIRAKNGVQNGPISANGNEINELKMALDQAAGYKPKASYDEDAVAKKQQYANAANDIRSSLEQGHIDQGLHSLNEDMGRNITFGKLLDKASAKNPVSSLTTTSPDKLAMLQDISNRSGVNLTQAGANINKAAAQSGPSSGDSSGIASGTLKYLAQKLQNQGYKKSVSLQNAAQAGMDPDAWAAVLSAKDSQK